MSENLGRPSVYTLEMADKICALLAIGTPLTKIAKEDWCPSLVTLYSWLRTNDAFLKMYTRAKEDAADTLADEIISISDDGSNDTYVDENGFKRTDTDVIARSKLRVEARKWVAAKLKPRKYGDKLAVGGDADGDPIMHSMTVSFVAPKK